MTKVEETERQIAQLLAKLETETEMLVESIEISDIDVTCYGDKGRRLSRRVVIELSRPPGHQWST